MREGLARWLPGWPWGPGSSRAVTVTGPTGLRAQRALCTVQPQPGVLRQRVPVRWCCTVYNGPLCLCPFCILHDSPERSESKLARAVCLPPSQGHEVLRRPAGFCSRRAVRVALPNRRRSSETIGVFTVRLAGRAPVVSGRGGCALRTSGRECVAPGRGLKAAGQAVRPSAEHGRPEVRLTFSEAPVCQPQRDQPCWSSPSQSGLS